ncbi:MAG: hypothetical protein BRD50_02180 [Bacteroidetes bacterium SW_11_45_7]|nr:MAG: hypothetical protein BRD50_02180 [Bacteroidetes bacterium SW_11_45_7]
MRMLLILLLLSNTCFAQLGNPDRPVYQKLLAAEQDAAGEEIEVMGFDEFQQKWLSQKHGKVTVYNFWATWCKPCVKELPYFEKVYGKYEDKGLNVVLVSLDYVKKLEEDVKPFVQKRDLQAEVLLLNAPDYNAWIDQVSKDWSGAIPATLIVNHQTGKKHFYEKEFEYDELNSMIQQQLNR